MAEAEFGSHFQLMASKHAALRPMRAPLGTRPHPWVVLLCVVCMGLCVPSAPIAVVFAGTSLGALAAFQRPLQSMLAAPLLLLGLVLVPGGMHSALLWMVIAAAAALAIIPRGWVTRVLSLPRSTWLVAVTILVLSISSILLGLGMLPAITGMLAATYIGASVVRHLALNDARLLSWGDEGLAAVTRDLLLGRVTSGMLHDLAQPLNVISMANGNMGYIVEHLAIGDDERRHLVDRIDRVASHTQNAAAILSLFRWFGRDGSDDPAALTVRSALDRAVASTRSNVRHHGVGIELQGNALDYPLPTRHGALEMMSVAALLCAFASFIDKDGTKLQGKVLLHAALSPAHVVVSVQCIDTEGRPVTGKPMDHATAWLVEQVAKEASGDFRALSRDSRPERFVIRLGRDDT